MNPWPNLHHLELFYHVARSGGITAATRSMKYGIQQPAVSGQISQLESSLGVRLFQRRPFQLTPAGRELQEFLDPFFSRLPEVAARITGRASRRLRLAAPTTLFRDHLPAVLTNIRKVHPDLEVALTDANQSLAFEMLEREEIDLAVTEVIDKAPPGIRHETLISMSLRLILPPTFSPKKNGLAAIAAALPLIRPPSGTAVSRLFTTGLQKAQIDWRASIEVDSLELVHRYVQMGFGAGVSLCIPDSSLPPELKVLPLPSFPKLDMAGFWRGKLTPLAEMVMAELRERAKI